MSTAITAEIQGQQDLISLNLEQLQALSSPATSDVFWSFSYTDPMSAREVAQEIGKASSTTGYHIEKLLEVGLILKAGTRKRRSRIEQLYVQAANKVRANLRGKDEEFYDSASKGFSALCRSLAREREAAYKTMAVDNDWGDKMIYRTVKVYLTPEDARIAEELVYKLHSHVRENSVSSQDAADKEEIKRLHVFSYICPTKNESRKHSKKKK